MNGRAAAAAGVLVLVTMAGCGTRATPVISGLRTPNPTPSAVPTTSSPTANATPSVGPPGIGAPGIGDPLFPNDGNGGYDVGNYDLDVRYDPATDRLSGTATITATASMGLSRFNLDFKALSVETVTIDGAAARTQQDDEELEVTPAEPIAAGQKFVTVVRYGGVPEEYNDPTLGVGGLLATTDGAVAIGEPDVAASWYPVNDHPLDKATYTIRITAPDGLTAISNGLLEGKQSNSGWTTWRWVEDKPMASYLATMVVGDFRVQQTVHGTTPVYLAVSSTLDKEVDTELAQTPDIVDFLAAKFGPYPFDAMGGVVIGDRRIHYALENQTRPIYGPGFFTTGNNDTAVIAHELAHQWYGDSVSLTKWQDIWLNEGFATYGEWMWDEHLGQGSLQQTFDRYYNEADNRYWMIPPGTPNGGDLFSDPVYTRGGMTLHVLRLTVGDDAFFTILRDWASEHAYGNASTDQFIALCERVSGKQLDKLFQDWLFGTVRPAHP